VEDRRDAAAHETQRALSEKESELAKRMRELDERSTLADAQKIEIITLKTKIGALEEQLKGATHELKAVEDRRTTERIELEATTQKLIEERGEFENFHRRVAELVQQLMAQSTKDKNLSRRAEVEKRLVRQSRLLGKTFISNSVCAARPRLLRKGRNRSTQRDRRPRGISPPRTSRPRRQSCRLPSIALMASGCGLPTSSPI
jgi:hypothetical protein